MDTKKFSVKEAAPYLGVSQKKVRKLLNERKIEFFHVDARIVISQKALDDYIERGTVKVVDAKAIAKDFLKH